jgi:hypothetical protein
MGSHIDHRSNLALDLVIYERSILTSDKINTEHIDVPPKVVVEVDVNFELENPGANIFDE